MKNCKGAENDFIRAAFSEILFCIAILLFSLGMVKLCEAEGRAVNAFGDSITAGFGASDNAHSYANIVASSKNWTFTNQAISGSETAGIAYKIFGTPVTSGNISFYLPGYNDMRHHGATEQAMDEYEKKVMNFASWLTTTNKFLGQDTTNISYTGTWNNVTIYSGVTNLTRYSNTQNNTAQATVNGKTIFIGYTALTTGSGGSFSVMVDGMAYGNFTSYGALDDFWGLGYAPFVIRISDLSDGPHSVLITVTSETDTSNKVYIDWIGGSMDSSQRTRPALYLGNTLRMNAE
ncbi:MAG: SGNH/GDSL hydrolase family protein [Thermodesulfovibrionales bacterium]